MRSFNAENTTFGVADYFRNTNNELDSIVMSLRVENYGNNHVKLRPGGEIVMDATGLDRVYLFLMAAQNNDYSVLASIY